MSIFTTENNDLSSIFCTTEAPVCVLSHVHWIAGDGGGGGG